MNEEVFKRVLGNHKRLIYQIGGLSIEELGLKKNIHFIIRAKKQARELSLAYSNCCCSKCKSEERLSFHHFIMRLYKEFMDRGRYITARTYWNNLLVLCWDCHKEIHNVNKDAISEAETDIPESLKELVRKKYGLDTSSLSRKGK